MSNQRGQSGGGLWNTTRPSISAETQNMLKGNLTPNFSLFLLGQRVIFQFEVMMQESKLTNFQQRTINDKLSSNISNQSTIIN